VTQDSLGPAQTCPVHNGRDAPYEIVFRTANALCPTIPEGVVVVFFPPQNRATYAIVCKYNVEPSRPQTTIWYMRVACWIPKVTNTHLEYVVLIAFPLQQWLHERTLMLCYTHTDCLAIYDVNELVLYSVAHTPTLRTCCLSTSVNVSTAFSHLKYKIAQVRKFHCPKIVYK